MSETALPDETPTTRSSSALDEGQRQARIREGLTMALYIGLSLLAVMVALPRNVTAALDPHPAVTLFLTSISLLIAHQLAWYKAQGLIDKKVDAAKVVASSFAK